MALQIKSGLIIPTFALACTLLCLAQAQETSQQTSPPDPPSNGADSDAVPSANTLGSITLGNVNGTVVDQSGAVIAGAEIRLTAKNPGVRQEALSREAQSGSDGQFSFTNIPAGPFQLTITSGGFSPQTVSGNLDPGETNTVSPIILTVATNVTQVQVRLTRAEVAEVAAAELKVEEKQRVLGVVPNFYVTYVPDAAPLTPKQKFQLAMKNVIDPFTFLVVAGTAGVEQAQNHFIGYGQGTEGYAKRFGAGYADTVTGTFIGGAIFPSILKQDPRYFYKGTGTTLSRIRYAIAMSVICKGDNKRWQANYSNILGNLAAGGISNLYYPPQDRDGAELTFENAAIGIGASAITNLLQEFVVRKFTPKLPKPDSSKP